MRVAGALPLQPVLRAGYGDGGELAADAADRPGVHRPPVPRQPAADAVAERAGGSGPSRARRVAEAAQGAGGALSQTEAECGRPESAGVAVSMDGRGRCLDKVFVERLWRSVKYEDLYLWRYETVPPLQQGLGRYFPYYNEERRHQALDYRTPAQVYQEGWKAG